MPAGALASRIPSFGGRWAKTEDEDSVLVASSSKKRAAPAYEKWAELSASKIRKIKKQEQESIQVIDSDTDSEGEIKQKDNEGESSSYSVSALDVESIPGANVNGKAVELIAQAFVDEGEDEDAHLWEGMDLPPPPRLDGEPPLSLEQRSIMNMIVESGRSLMFTGGAGTGKSVLLRAVVKALRAKYGPSRIGICAMTGIAALHVGGQTLHSWAGIGLGNLPAPALAKSVRKKVPVRQRWQECKVLLVDEISMLDAVLFDKLDYVAKDIRSSTKPFGGLQLVMVGDFYQLPPVITNPTIWNGSSDSQRKEKLAYQKLCQSYKSRFVFDAKAWTACIPRTIVLKTVFRQSDPKFVRMLEETRRSRLSQDTIAQYYALSRPLDTSDGILPTELFPTRNQVKDANETRLQELPGELVSYTSLDRSAVHGIDRLTPGSHAYKQKEDEIRTFLDRHMIALHKVEIKEGAQVMLIKNLSNGLVNGSRGKVVGFQSVSGKTQLIENEYGNAYLMDDDKKVKPDPNDFANNVGSKRVKGELISNARVNGTAWVDDVYERSQLHLRGDSKVWRGAQASTSEMGIKSQAKPDPDAAAASMAHESKQAEREPAPVKAEPSSQQTGRKSALVDGDKQLTGSSSIGRMEGSVPIHDKQGQKSTNAKWGARTIEAEGELGNIAAKLEPGASGRAEMIDGKPSAPKLNVPALTLEESNDNRAEAERNALDLAYDKEAIEVGIAAGSKRVNGALPNGIEYADEGVLYPVVQFVNGQTVLMVPLIFAVESHIGHEEASRIQVPLILAWSMSIHKAQGQTLDKVKIDLSKTFEKGQAYVALSRATHLGGIQVTGFHPSKVRMDPNVLEWEESVGREEPVIWAQEEKEAAKGRRVEEKQAAKKQSGADKVTRHGQTHKDVRPKTPFDMVKNGRF